MNTFKFNNKEYTYFDHPGNQTRVNERRMELPIAFAFVEKYKDVLEVGNVTRHYHREWTHDVVDRYEKAKWLIFNEDVLNYVPTRHYNASISVSTVEHTLDSLKAIKNIISFAPKYLITTPFGYTTTKDILNWDLPNTYYMTRVDEDNHWVQVSKQDILNKDYGKPFPFANTVCIITND